MTKQKTQLGIRHYPFIWLLIKFSGWALRFTAKHGTVRQIREMTEVMIDLSHFFKAEQAIEKLQQIGDEAENIVLCRVFNK